MSRAPSARTNMSRVTSARTIASAKSTRSAKHAAVVVGAPISLSKVYMGQEFEHRLANAARIGDVGTVSKILKFKVNPNARDENRNPALTNGCLSGCPDVVQMLIASGADVNLIANYNVTPLHAAVKGGNVNCVKHVILAGANLNAQTTAGMTAMNMAKFASEIWEVISDAKKGEMPEIEEISEVPEIPDYALPDEAAKKSKKGKKGKKGGKKGGKKKGGKKKGGKKKKKK